MDKSTTNTTSFFKRVPVIFLLISLFLLAITIWDALSWIGDKRVDIIYWFRPTVLIMYTALWIGSTFLKKWAATGFIIFTIIHLLLFLFVKDNETLMRITDNIMVTPLPLNIGLSVIILFYYRKMG